MDGPQVAVRDREQLAAFAGGESGDDAHVGVAAMFEEAFERDGARVADEDRFGVDVRRLVGVPGLDG
nr:hypothetical protein [Cumulibacter soli]